MADAPKFGPRYERVTFINDHGKKKAVFLRVTRETDKILAGFEIDKSGDEINPGGGADRRMRMISKDLITSRTRYVMNLLYATLERAK